MSAAAAACTAACTACICGVGAPRLAFCIVACATAIALACAAESPPAPAACTLAIDDRLSDGPGSPDDNALRGSAVAEAGAARLDSGSSVVAEPKMPGLEPRLVFIFLALPILNPVMPDLPPGLSEIFEPAAAGRGDESSSGGGGGGGSGGGGGMGGNGGGMDGASGPRCAASGGARRRRGAGVIQRTLTFLSLSAVQSAVFK